MNWIEEPYEPIRRLREAKVASKGAGPAIVFDEEDREKAIDALAQKVG